MKMEQKPQDLVLRMGCGIWRWGAVGIATGKSNPLVDNSTSLPGLITNKVGETSPGVARYAPFVDAAGQFVPGVFSGGNILGLLQTPGDLRAALQAGNATKAFMTVAGAVDAYGDIGGVVEAAREGLPPAVPTQSAPTSAAYKSLYNKIPNSKNLSRKEASEIRDFIKGLK